MVGKVGVVREMPLRSESSGMGFVVGDRYTISMVYRTQDEARLHRSKVLGAITAAVESVERWAPERRFCAGASDL